MKSFYLVSNMGERHEDKKFNALKETKSFIQPLINQVCAYRKMIDFMNYDERRGYLYEKTQ